MRATGSPVLACLACLLLAGPAPSSASPPAAASGDAILERASRAYRETPALFATARYLVRIPGAPLHEESQDFGWGHEVEAWIHMPATYVMQVHHDRLFLVEEGRLEQHIESSMAAGLQAAIDSAFGGQGPPLAPAPLQLKRASNLAQMRDAFRVRLLNPLRTANVRTVVGPSGMPCDDVELAADNGTVHARFDRRHGSLVGASIAFVPAPGADTIRAEVSYTSHPTPLPQPLSESRLRAGRRVTRLDALGGDASTASPFIDPGPRFVSKGGAPIGISSLGKRLVVLEFWATWCAPCRAAIPGMAKFAQWARDSTLDVACILINTEESETDITRLRPRVERYLGRLGVNTPCWIDSGGVVHRMLGSGLPLTLLLGADGRVIEMHAGFQAGLADTLTRHVRALLAKSQ
jgi:cytochrome c biogenesis protein CcmG/thiol:disulfide interchange protein DsbE